MPERRAALQGVGLIELGEGREVEGARGPWQRDSEIIRSLLEVNPLDNTIR